MNTHNLVVGETGDELLVEFLSRVEGISDATAVELQFWIGATKYTRAMTIVSDTEAIYQFTTADFDLLNAPMDVPCRFQATTPSGILYWPKPGRDQIRVELP